MFTFRGPQTKVVTKIYTKLKYGHECLRITIQVNTGVKDQMMSMKQTNLKAKVIHKSALNIESGAFEGNEMWFLLIMCVEGNFFE